ncbi:arylesterase [Pacificimonas flava]|uniref:Arylesterase n=2 Tax=Pacificimonas TaxID=1960290 RepID=A0A219B4E3_9SPHN|nr:MULTISPECIES: arylesterase [Pacificimonas]MBZ6379564.1 arylesterase [Pacificimonas aurantium]OWV33252.1 arylesterase [Pacificimonas flava]
MKSLSRSAVLLPKPLAYRALALLVYAAIWAVSSAVSLPASAQQRTILAFGDSLTAGYQLRQSDGFAPQLETALRAEGIPANVINAGVSGDTSARGLERLDWTLNRLDRKPDLVILELGANDMLRSLSPRETLRNLNAILEELAARDIEVLLAGMLAPSQVGEDEARYFNAVYPFLAKRHDVPLYPFFMREAAFRPHLLLEDGLHPNAEGVRRIVSGILPAVRRALDEAP